MNVVPKGLFECVKKILLGFGVVEYNGRIFVIALHCFSGYVPLSANACFFPYYFRDFPFLIIMQKN